VTGCEKGIPHHGFTETELHAFLEGSGFEVSELRVVEEHYNVLAVKK
jgi:hypothetical protein